MEVLERHGIAANLLLRHSPPSFFSRNKKKKKQRIKKESLLQRLNFRLFVVRLGICKAKGSEEREKPRDRLEKTMNYEKRNKGIRI